jgi:glycosyltransferase involved in cell wall biosynthesis
VIRVAFLIPGDLSSPTGGYAYDREVLSRLERHGIAGRHVALPAGYPFPTDGDLARTVGDVAACADSDVLLIDGLAYGAFPAALLAGLPKPVVALVHHPLGHEAGLDPVVARALIASETAALAMARHAIVTSPATARLLVSDLAVPETKITVALPGTARAPRAIGSPSGAALHLVAVGAVSRRKAYDVMVRALATLADRSWRATIAGAVDRQPDVADELRSLIAAAVLSDRVRMTGGLSEDDLDRLYAEADIFLMPSLFEGYGMVLAEAMARGLPIVCTTGGAAAETVPDCAALKVPPGDVACFAAAVGALLDEPATRTRLAEASWSAGQRLPDWDETTAAIAAVLKEAAR